MVRSASSNSNRSRPAFSTPEPSQLGDLVPVRRVFAGERPDRFLNRQRRSRLWDSCRMAKAHRPRDGGIDQPVCQDLRTRNHAHRARTNGSDSTVACERKHHRKESMSATTLSSALDCEKARSTNNRVPLDRPGKTSGTPESNERSQVLASGSPTPGAPKTERYSENSGRIATPGLSASRNKMAMSSRPLQRSSTR